MSMGIACVWRRAWRGAVLLWAGGLSLAGALETVSETRQAVSLDGEWQLVPVEKAEAVLPLPQEGWKPQAVPAWAPIPETDNPAEAKLHSCWIKRAFEVPADWQGRHVRLEFEAVSRHSKVYLNGQFLGEHLDMYSPFSFDITKTVKFGQANEVAVWMTTESTLANCSLGEGAGPPKTGIWQSVQVAAYPAVRIEDVFVMTSVRKKEITARVSVSNASGKERSGGLSCEIRKWEAGGDGARWLGSAPVLKLAGEFVKLGAGETKTVDLQAKWEAPELWTPDEPRLYVASTRLSAADVEDVRHDRFGFREFWVEGTQFVLNGVKVFLPMLWADWYTEPEGDLKDPKSWGPYSDYRKGFRAAKASGIRALRFPHYGSGRTLAKALDAADETGMMLMMTNTFFFFWSPFRDKPEFWQHSEPMVRAVVRRDRNHPSVILWSMSCEWIQCAQDWQYETRMLRQMELVAREEDPTRLSFQSGSGALNGQGEIISLHYPHESMYAGSFTEMPQTAYWLEEAKEVRSAYLQYGEKTGDKPVILTESFHVLYPGCAGAMYFWTGEKLFDLRLRGEWWGRLTEDVEDLAGMSIAGLRAAGAAAVTTTGGLHLRHNEVDLKWQRAFAPVVANPREYDSRFFAGDKVVRTYDIHNDLLTGPSEVAFQWRGFAWRDNAFVPVSSSTNPEHNRIPQQGETKMTLAGGERRKVSFEFTAGGTGDGREHFQWHHGPMLWSIQTRVLVNGEIRFTENHDCTIYRKEFPALVLDAPVALLDPSGEARSASSQALDKLQVAHKVVSAAAAVEYPESAILVIAEDALAQLDLALIRPKLLAFTAAGGWVVCLEQDEFPSGWLPLDLQPDQADLSRRATMVQPIDPSHPVLAGLAAEDLRFWRGDHYVTRQNLVKPAEGNFRPILAYGNGSTPYVDRTPLLEVLNGRGGYLLCQALVVEKFDAEPAASRLLANLLTYAQRRQMQAADGLSESLALVLPESELGKKDWLESLGAKIKVVAPKTAQDLGASQAAALVLAKDFPDASTAKALQEWVRGGGKLLVLGLTAELTTEGAAFCQAPTRLLKPRMWPTSKDSVIKCKADDLTQGLSNGDLCWEGKALVPEQFVRLDGALVSDLTRDPLLQKVEMGKGLLLVSQLPLATEKDFEPARRTTSILLTNLGVSLTPKVFAARTAKEDHFPVDLRKACNMGFKDDKAGDGQGGWTDQGENDLRKFPVGKQKLCGVDFDIIDPAANNGKSCIVLKGKNAPALPLQSALIDVGNQKWDKLYFLHGGGFIGAGRQAYYRIKYTAMIPPESLEAPVVAGKEIADWWAAPANLPNGQVAWTGENPVRGAGGVSIYVMEWKNPFPEREIMSIQMVSDVDGTVGLIAVTGVKGGAEKATGESPGGLEKEAKHTIRIDGSDLKADPDGTFRYHDGYAPLQACRSATGDEAAGGPVYARFWRRTYATSNLRIFWQYNGGLSYLAADAWRKGGRAASFTLKYELPPKRAIERGAARCKFDYWHNGRAEGCSAAILVSNDNRNWVEVVRFTGGKEEHWTNAPKAAKDSQEYPGTECPLPKEVKGWQTLYVKCLIDGEAAPQASNHDIQMVRENWGEKGEHYALDLVVR